MSVLKKIAIKRPSDQQAVEYDLGAPMTGATSNSAGAAGYVPTPAAGDQNKVLQGDGTWVNPPSGLPSVSGSDNNKVLKVVNGSWAAAESGGGGGSGGADATIVAEEYDPTATYPTVGSYCTHNGALCRSLVPITVAEAWNSSHWEVTNVMNEFVDHHSSILPAAGVYF